MAARQLFCMIFTGEHGNINFKMKIAFLRAMENSPNLESTPNLCRSSLSAETPFQNVESRQL